MLGSIGLVSNLWFGDHERARATAIMGLMAPVGSLLGLGLTGVIAAGVDSSDPQDCNKRLQTIIYCQNIWITLTCILFIFLFREKPEMPPSKLALMFRKLAQTGIIEDIVTLSKNRDFMLNMTVFIIIWGSYTVLGNVLTPLFQD